MCGEGQGALGVPWWTQKRWLGHRLGPGNTNVAGSRVGRGTTRYTTLLVPTQPHHPGYYPSPTHGPATMFVPGNSRFEVDQGDPRGVIRTQYGQCTLDHRTPALRRPRRPTGPAPWGLLRSVVGLPSAVSLRSQLYLSISQYFSDILRYPLYLSYSQYFSVFLSICRSPPTGPCPALRSHCRINEEQLSSAQMRGY